MTRCAIPSPCVYELASVATNVRVWNGAASSNDDALLQLEASLRSRVASLLAETEDTWRTMIELCRRPRVRGGVFLDARNAVLCLAHGVREFLSADRDVSLFPELPTRNPLPQG